MSGVQRGSRLEQLRRLRAQVDAEIHAEERRIELARPLPVTLKGPTGRKNIVDRTLAELGVTANDVKRWAVSAGLLDAVKRGRVSQRLVEQYADAHPGGC